MVIWMIAASSMGGQVTAKPVFSGNDPIPSYSGLTTHILTIQTQSSCQHCGKNTVALLTNVASAAVFNIVIDSLGHGLQQGLSGGTYTLSLNQFSCQPVFIPNLAIWGDTVITINVAASVAPARFLSVDPQTLLATWIYPEIVTDILNEDWSAGNFTTNGWNISGGNNWIISNSTGNPPPEAQFTGAFGCNNCSQYLTSKILDAGGAPMVLLTYSIMLEADNNPNPDYLNVEVWNGAVWTVLKMYDNLNGSFPWITDVINITQFTASDFRIRFHPYGQDVTGINSWNIDNIKVQGKDTMTGLPPSCMFGYNAGCNNTLSAFVTDTSYQIDPDQLNYGQACNFCVTAIYTSGSAPSTCHTVTSQYLYPVKNLSVATAECRATVSWEKTTNLPALTGLTGYKIFRNYQQIAQLNNPDILTYADTSLTPGLYKYGVMARYDLGIYGFPGQTGESLILWRQGQDTIHCGFDLPFLETWSSGNFSANNWAFAPSAGNWGIGNGLKTGDPCVAFQGYQLQQYSSK